MSTATSLSDQLKVSAANLFALANVQGMQVEARTAELDLQIHDAQAHEHRRAAFNQRDRNCYRLGGAFEPTAGLHLDPVTLTGFLALGSSALLLLVQQVTDVPGASVIELLDRLFRSRAGRVIRDHGVWVRWKWLRELYVAETQIFLAGPKGRNPKAKWRASKVTVNQIYIAAEICLDLQLEIETIAARRSTGSRRKRAIPASTNSRPDQT